MLTQRVWRSWSLWLQHCGLPDDHIATVLNVDVGAVAAYLAAAARWRHPRRRPCLPLKPVPEFPLLRPILSHTCRHIRTLRDLGYDHDAIGRILILLPSRVADFLARLEPLRRPRVDPDRLTRPRYDREERKARQSLRRAEDLRQDRQEGALAVDPAVAERKAMLRLQRSPVDAWGSRGVSTEVADYARLLDSIRTGRLSGAALVGLAARVYYASPQGSAPRELPTIEPAIWTGDVGLHVSRVVGVSVVLTAEQILEAADLLRSGMAWDHVAKRFGVAENTLRRYIKDIAPRHPRIDRPSKPKKVQAPIELPTEMVRCRGGVVHWELPLRTIDDGRGQTVFVECDCGRKRHESVTEVMRSPRGFKGTCARCLNR